MAADELTVYETGPDGEKTYQLVIGRDIDAADAEELISRSGGKTVYAMHHYDAGNRIESFISKKMFDQLQGAMSQTDSKRRNIDAIKSDIARRSTMNKATRRKPWWAFWR